MQTTASRLALFFTLALLSACRTEGLELAHLPGTGSDGGLDAATDAARATAQACSSHADVSACEADSKCHAIFAEADTLTCAGCAPGFLACADGTARCLGQSCAIRPIVCSPGYRVGYEPNGCEEGCVRESACSFDKNDCRTNGCAQGLDCIQCGSLAWACLSDCA